MDKLHNSKTIITNIINSILSALKPITTFITSYDNKHFIIAYIIILVIVAYLIQVYRNRKLKQQEYNNIIKNTSRSKAIESFNNYNQQIIEKLYKECNDTLSDPTYNPDTDITKDTLIKQGLFYLDIETQYRAYILKNLINKSLNVSKTNTIDNLLLNLDTELNVIVNKHVPNYIDIINNTNNFIKTITKQSDRDLNIKDTEEYKYIRISKLQEVYDSIIKELNDTLLIEFDNNTRTQLSFDESNGVAMMETPLLDLIKMELFERIYYKIYLDYKEKNIFVELCSTRKGLTDSTLELNSMFQKSFDTDTRKQNSILSKEREIETLKVSLTRLQNIYELYLRTLKLFSTSRDTNDKLKKKILSISNSDIQPSNENIIDYLNTYKNNEKSKLSSSPSNLSIDTDMSITAENITASHLNELNASWNTELKNRNNDTRLDIGKIFSDTEESVIGFLDNIYKTESRNNTSRFDTTLSDRGFWLQNPNKPDPKHYYLDNNLRNNIDVHLNSVNINTNLDTKSNLDTNSNLNINYKLNNNINNNISQNNNITQNNMVNTKPIIEGFEDIENNAQNTNTNTDTDTNTNNSVNNNLRGSNLPANRLVTRDARNNETDLLEQIGSQFLNITKTLMNNAVIQRIFRSIMQLLKLDNIKTSEQVGVLLVIASILLYFIDLSS